MKYSETADVFVMMGPEGGARDDEVLLSPATVWIDVAFDTSIGWIVAQDAELSLMGEPLRVQVFQAPEALRDRALSWARLQGESARFCGRDDRI